MDEISETTTDTKKSHQKNSVHTNAVLRSQHSSQQVNPT